MKIFLGVLATLLVPILTLGVVMPMFGIPTMNDVTTSTSPLPQFDKIALSLGDKGMNQYPEEFIELQKKHYADIGPKVLKLASGETVSDILKRVEKLAKVNMGWNVVSVDEGALRLEATATTALLKFKDDIVIELRPSSSDGAEVQDQVVLHMRSKSRLGKGDLGANAKRIRHFLALF
jgi:uncharacterized protein (DUF1499 family)